MPTAIASPARRRRTARPSQGKRGRYSGIRWTSEKRAALTMTAGAGPQSRSSGRWIQPRKTVSSMTGASTTIMRKITTQPPWLLPHR